MNYPFSIIKEQYQPLLFQIYCVFAEQELQQGDIIVTNYDTSLLLGMHILKKVCHMTTSFPAIHFFYDSVFFYGSTWSNLYVKDIVFI